MNEEERAGFASGEATPRDYLAILFSKWWVVASIFIIAVIGSFLGALGIPDVYQVQTKLLITSPLSNRVINSRSSSRSGLQINPFLGTSISYETLSEMGTAHLDLFDLRGRRLASQDVSALGPGSHVVTIRPEAGMTSGVYIIRLTQGGAAISMKVAFVR